MFLKKEKLNTGFTLIELMVSISIFSMVMVVVIGALLVLNDANKKAQALRAVVDNLNFAIEDVTRNIRMGSDFKCGYSINPTDNTVSGTPADCIETNGKEGIEVISFKGQMERDSNSNITSSCYLYAFIPATATNIGTIRYKKLTNVSKDQSCTFGALQTSLFIAPEVQVNAMRFYVFDQHSNPTSLGQQPIVILALSGEIDLAQFGGNKKFTTPFNIQTTVSVRSSSE